MPKSAMIRARVKPEIKDKAEEILDKLGLSTSEVISMLYCQIILRNGIPFSVEIPNAITKKSFDDYKNKKGLKRYENVDKLFKDLEE